MAILIKSKNKVPTTLQGIFNRAYRWASRKEFKQCVSNDGEACRYRSEDGENACLIGACIPDNLYQDDMENTTADMVLKRCGVNIERINNDPSSYILRKLQECHDDYEPSGERCLEALREYAKYYKLKVPTVK
jgi:hypothetical protein